jgi:pimeloyl-ACP methyl ester carboxylesterase
MWRIPPKLHVAHDSGAGPAVVLLHGIAASSVTFKNVIPLLDHHRVIALDLLGFGESPAPAGAEYSVEEHVAAIKRTLRSLRIRGPYTLVGHARGAQLAARIAARNPHRIRRLVLVSPPIYILPAELSRLHERELMGLYLRAYRFIRENQEFTLRNAHILQRLLPVRGMLDITERTWTPFVKSLANSIEQQTALSDLADVRVPAAIIVGSNDEFTSSGAMKIAGRLQGVSLHRVPGGYHMIGRRLARAVVQEIDA